MRVPLQAVGLPRFRMPTPATLLVLLLAATAPGLPAGELTVGIEGVDLPAFDDATATFVAMVADLPETVTLCADGEDRFQGAFPEYRWTLWIDLDGDAETGLSIDGMEGVEFFASIQTPLREDGCTPATFALADLHVVSGEWDATVGYFRSTDLPFRLRIDPAAGELWLELDRRRGALQQLGQGSVLGFTAAARVVVDPFFITLVDSTSPMPFLELAGQSTDDVAADVQCSACDDAQPAPAAMLDLLFFSAALQAPGPVDLGLFGNGFEP